MKNKTSKILISLIAVFAILLSFSILSGAVDAPTLTLGASGGNVGDVITVTVRADGVSGLLSGDIYLEYDHDSLEYQGFEAGDLNATIIEGGQSYDGADAVCSFIFKDGCAVSSGVICSFKFTAKTNSTNILLHVASWRGTDFPTGASLAVSVANPNPGETTTTKQPSIAEPDTEEPSAAEPDTEPSTEPTNPGETTTADPDTEPSTNEPSTEPEADIELKDESFKTYTLDGGEKVLEIPAGKKAGDVLSGIANENVKITNEKGEDVQSDSSAGTGCKVEILDKNGSSVSQYTILVPKDVNGDGEITASDARAALRTSAKLEALEGVKLYSADTDGDKTIKASDARKILRVSAKLE